MNRTLDISNYGFTVNYQLGKVSTTTTKMVEFIHSCWLAGVSRGPKSKKNKYCFQQQKYKDDQNGLIHPEN